MRQTVFKPHVTSGTTKTVVPKIPQNSGSTPTPALRQGGACARGRGAYPHQLRRMAPASPESLVPRPLPHCPTGPFALSPPTPVPLPHCPIAHCIQTSPKGTLAAPHIEGLETDFLDNHQPPPLVQATANDRKWTDPTPRVAWTRALRTRHTVRGTWGGGTWCTILKAKGARYATKALMPQSASLTQNTSITHLKAQVSGSTHHHRPV